MTPERPESVMAPIEDRLFVYLDGAGGLDRCEIRPPRDDGWGDVWIVVTHARDGTYAWLYQPTGEAADLAAREIARRMDTPDDRP